MFYSHFVLQKKGPLARIWLAAHWDKKLTKAQVFETNIETSVDGILKPKVKIALRTSGHLLLGVVRIYSRKAKYLLADCNEAFVKIKMAFRPGMVDLPEENKEAHTIALQDVFQNFDETMPDLNDVDIEAQFSLNQSRAEEITMREEYNLCLPHEEGFGDMGFDNEPPDMLRNTVDQSHLLFSEPEHLSMPEKDPQPSTSRAAARSLEIDTPIRGDGFGGNLGQDIMSGGLFEGGLSLFDDPPIVSEMPGVSDMGQKDGQDRPDPPPPDSDDDGDHDFGAPPSVGGHSSDGSRPASPMPVHLETNLSHLAEAAAMQPGPSHIQASPLMDMPHPDQTTLIQNEEESFALAPVDASAIRGIQKAKRKRKLIVDEVKNISGEEMKAQLSDTSDIVISLDLAPPTKRLMLWKESGGVEKLFALPSRQITARSLFKGYQRMLTLRVVENDAELDKQDDIPLEQIRDADGENVENVPPSTNKRGRKRKQPEIEESIQLQQKEPVAEQSISVQGEMLAPPTPMSVPLAQSMNDNFSMMPPTPNVSELVPPMSVAPELPLSMFPPPQTPLQQIEDIPADQLHSLLENTQMENMGYDHNNPYANLGYDEQHPPATTPGAISEKGAPTPWNEDYDFPQSAGPPEEQQTDETDEQYEERVVNKRAAHMYQILKSRFARQDTLQFSEMTHRSTKKQVSQKFYTLLVLKKTQVLELEQEAAFDDILITKGASYETPVLRGTLSVDRVHLILGGWSQNTDHHDMASKLPESAHSCEICGVEGLLDDEMRSHVLQHVGNSISCPFCDLSNISSDEMIVHVNTTHLDYLTPNSESFSFIDDDDDDDDNATFVISPVAQKKVNGWERKPLQPTSEIINNNINNVDLVASCSNMRGEGSPQRSQLNLNLRSRNNVISKPQLPCPMCAHKSGSPVELEEHINRVHFDPMSPSLPPASNGVTSIKDNYHCPFCIQTFADSPDLEIHVNLEHSDILSPAKQNVAGAIGTDNWSVQCPVCCRSNFRSNKTMMAHIESHFVNGPSASAAATPDSSCDRLLAREMERRERETRKAQEQREFEMLRAQYGMDNQGNFKEQSIANMQKAVYAGEMSVADYYEKQVELRQAEHCGVDDGSSCTKGLVPKLRAISSGLPSVVRIFLCTTVDHYASTYGDKGWGCGYRNVQMLISSLIHHTGYNEQLYKPAVAGGGLFGGDTKVCSARSAVPSISRLQQHIEWAWREGFDVQGAEQLDSKLYNTRKWIGATEVVTALSSLRIRCQLVDFHQSTAADGSHPDMFAWVLNYFQRQQDFTPPLYLQHQGHSRTIVGVELHKEGNLTLLLFDPSHSPEQMSQLKCTQGSVAGMRLTRKTSAAMKARQYQLVAVCGIMATEREYEDSKILRSVRVPADR